MKENITAMGLQEDTAILSSNGTSEDAADPLAYTRVRSLPRDLRWNRKRSPAPSFPLGVTPQSSSSESEPCTSK